MTRFCGGAGAEGEGAGERSSLRGWYGAISCGRWGADALSEPAPKPGAGLVSVCGRAGEEQPQIPRSAYPAKSGRGPRRAVLRDDTVWLESGSNRLRTGRCDLIHVVGDYHAHWRVAGELAIDHDHGADFAACKPERRGGVLGRCLA